MQLVMILLLQVVFLWSCQDNKEAPPFPIHENEYLQPVTKDFSFSEQDTLTWIVQDPAKIKSLPTTKFDWDKLPSKPFDIGVPEEFVGAMAKKELDWDNLPSTEFDLASLPTENLKVKTTVLGEPTIIRAEALVASPNSSRGVMIGDSDFGLPGVPNNAIKDKDGMLWFGTNKGIARYDSENIFIYGLEQGLEASGITDLFQDSKGRIWVNGDGESIFMIDLDAKLIREMTSSFNQTNRHQMIEANDGTFWYSLINGGYIILDFEAKTIKRFGAEQGLLGDFNITPFQDKDGLIWLSSGGGVNIIDLKAGKNTQLTKKDGLLDDFVGSFFQNDSGEIWISSGGGVNILNSDKSEVSYLTKDNGFRDLLASSYVSIDSHGIYWLGTPDGLLFSYDEEAGLINRFKLVHTQSNWVYDLIEDEQGDIWASIAQGGLFKINVNGGRPGNFQTDSGLGDDSYWATLVASDGKVWIGTRGGIDVYDPINKTLKHIGTAQGLIDETNSNLFEDKKGRIWASGSNVGLSIIDPKKGTIKKLSSNEGLPFDRITNTVEGDNGEIWMGSWSGGIINIDLDQSVYKSLAMKDSTENSTPIMRLIYVDEENLWLASQENGLSLIDTKTATRRRLNSSNGLVSDNVSSFAKDENDHIWTITDNGVQLIDTDNFKLTTFTRDEGLSANDGYEIINHNNKMFVGTSNGLTIIEPINEIKSDKIHWKVNTLGKEQGFTYVDFAQNSFSFDQDGRLWGGAGLTASESLFILDEIKEDTTSYPTHITALNIFDKPQVFSDREKIKEKTSNIDTLWARGKTAAYIVNKAAKDSIYLSNNDIQWESVKGPYKMPEGLTLPYTQNYLSFDYNGAQFNSPDKVVYRYILEGIDKSWSPVTDKTASENYRDLPPGEYTFKVASKGFNGVWSKPAELSFTIIPPWWQTWWAYTIFVALFLGLGLVILHYRSRWLKKENKILEEKVNERTSELKKTIDELENTQSQLIQSEKMASLGELTAGIAHEIQNPMNFINNFSEVTTELVGEMCEELDKGDIEEAKDISKDIIQNLDKISHHGKRASSIVRGMLEHSRNNSGQKEFIDINVLADEYLRLAYHGLRAKDKSFNADFKTDLDETLPKVEIIPQDLGRVILNIINNAFFAVTSIPEDQRTEGYQPLVTVSTKNMGDQVLISIKDNGPGIPAELKDKIFQPFFTTKPTGKGTGLGLSLAYDIVTTGHGGAIELNTEPGEGTEFVIYIPMKKK